jgi:bis(5'-nucleosyl)-tetraphosphatase (symmetrical)
MYTNDSWTMNLSGPSRINSIINSFTRIRFIDERGTCNFEEKNSPSTVDNSLLPWFKSKDLGILDKQIFFGHWSQLSYYNHNNIFCLDGGCLWGGELIGGVLEKPFKPTRIKSLN